VVLEIHNFIFIKILTMKTNSNVTKAIQLFFSIFIISHTTFAQDSTKTTASVQDWVNEKNFVFTPQTAMPMKGRAIHLTSYFDCRVSKDTLTSNLPYYGRSYSASINPSENGLSFVTTSFDYSVKTRKKGGWQVTIKPQKANDVREMDFTIFDNGSASLYVSSNNREAISFNGIVSQHKK